MAERYRADVLVCTCPACAKAGAQEMRQALEAELERRELAGEVRVIETGSRGFCSMGPVVVIQPEGILYCQVHAADVPELVEETLVKGRVVQRLAYQEPSTHEAVPYYDEVPFYGKQMRVVLRNCGLINPQSIEEYIAVGGYQALGKALTSMTPEEIIEEVKRAGLRGRGGAGFPTGRKWEFARNAPGDVKYIVANGDEGDPGAFMDRGLMEGDPHSVLEGLVIGAYAIGAHEGFIYVRDEYPLAVRNMQLAIEQVREYGLLGQDILGSGFDFDVKIVRGAGAFVCGEETALMASIEGRAGNPRPRPPFPAQSGLWGKPTNINNVKTWANIPVIISRGADWFSQIGTETSKGTMIFSLVGKVKNSGLVEVPMGITLQDLIYEIGGGGVDGTRVKAVQTGGPSGGCIPASKFDLVVDYEHLKEAGSIMGSGGMIVMDEDTCMVDVARYFLDFLRDESCGKCTPCREGIKQMLAILNRITSGEGEMADLERLEALAHAVKNASLCGLGQTAPNPVLSTLRYFRDEYIEHIVDKKCSAGVCTALVRGRCTNACPAEVDVPSYVALVAQGRYADAMAVHRRRNPFVLACGRVCPAFCENKCRRSELDEPIAIRQIKRFMADHEADKPWKPRRLEEPKEEKVAIVGSGPAGLTAALRLAQKGYPVTVFEALPVAGGMMAVGIPDYRLPQDTLKIEIENIKRAGVEIKLNTALGRDFTLDDLLAPSSPPRAGGIEGGYSAVILAIGAHKSRELGVPGEDKEGVYHGTTFLCDVALGNPPDLKDKKVVVVGGGDTAIDAARSAWRLGASEVHLVYRRTRADMPAIDEEVEAAEEEGIQFHFLTNPVRVLGDGRVTGVELARQQLGKFDASGRRRPEPIPGSEFTMDVDVLIPAIGQSPDLACIEGGSDIETGRGDTFVVNDGLGTTREGVFAAGDAASGPATVIQAVAQGNQVAVAVDHYLRTGCVEKVVLERDYEVVEQCFDMEEYYKAVRPKVVECTVEERCGSFVEVERTLDETTIQEECKRCIRCDLEWLETMGLLPTAEEVEVEEEVLA
jgi:NADH-quinone oxidoreductase subunit F